VCEAERRCRECGAKKAVNHECHKRFCSHRLKNRDAGTKLYMAHLADMVPRFDRLMFIFYDFETTQDTKCTDTSFEYVRNLVCVEQV
jgi:primosomal protein N'